MHHGLIYRADEIGLREYLAPDLTTADYKLLPEALRATAALGTGYIKHIATQLFADTGEKQNLHAGKPLAPVFSQSPERPPRLLRSNVSLIDIPRSTALHIS